MPKKPFSEVNVGEIFRWGLPSEDETDWEPYEKTEFHWRDRYGYVNCIGRPRYQGDTGHRHRYGDELVITDD